MKNGSHTTIELSKDRGKEREKAQTIAKPGLTKKVILCVWWDWKGIVHYELLSLNQTINSELYCEQEITTSN